MAVLERRVVCAVLYIDEPVQRALYVSTVSSVIRHVRPERQTGGRRVLGAGGPGMIEVVETCVDVYLFVSFDSHRLASLRCG